MWERVKLLRRKDAVGVLLVHPSTRGEYGEAIDCRSAGAAGPRSADVARVVTTAAQRHRWGLLDLAAIGRAPLVDEAEAFGLLAGGASPDREPDEPLADPAETAGDPPHSRRRAGGPAARLPWRVRATAARTVAGHGAPARGRPRARLRPGGLQQAHGCGAPRRHLNVNVELIGYRPMWLSELATTAQALPVFRLTAAAVPSRGVTIVRRRGRCRSPPRGGRPAAWRPAAARPPRCARADRRARRGDGRRARSRAHRPSEPRHPHSVSSGGAFATLQRIGPSRDPSG